MRDWVCVGETDDSSAALVLSFADGFRCPYAMSRLCHVRSHGAEVAVAHHISKCCPWMPRGVTRGRQSRLVLCFGLIA
eukprot:2181929-Amphidinium_carterae.1